MFVVDIEVWETQQWIFENSSSIQDNKSRKMNKRFEREEVGRILNSLKFYYIYVKDE